MEVPAAVRVLIGITVAFRYVVSACKSVLEVWLHYAPIIENVLTAFAIYKGLSFLKRYDQFKSETESMVKSGFSCRVCHNDIYNNDDDDDAEWVHLAKPDICKTCKRLGWFRWLRYPTRYVSRIRYIWFLLRGGKRRED